MVLPVSPFVIPGAHEQLVLFFLLLEGGGFLPLKQKQCEIQLKIIKSSGSQLSTEMAALWAPFILLRLV